MMALRYGSDTHLGGHLGYLDALELSGAVIWRQLKHRPAIEASGQRVGPSGFPCATYQLQSELAPSRALPAVEIVARAVLIEALEVLAARAASAKPEGLTRASHVSRARKGNRSLGARSRMAPAGLLPALEHPPP